MSQAPCTVLGATVLKVRVGTTGPGLGFAGVGLTSANVCMTMLFAVEPFHETTPSEGLVHPIPSVLVA